MLDAQLRILLEKDGVPGLEQSGDMGGVPGLASARENNARPTPPFP